jgi:hypothetical protein
MNNPLNNPKYMRDRNDWMRLLDRDSKMHHGCFRFAKKLDQRNGESLEHIEKKFGIVIERLKENSLVEFWTEIKSADLKHRGDLLFIYPPSAYAEIVEVAKTESEESLLKKDTYWSDLGFDVTIVRCDI